MRQEKKTGDIHTNGRLRGTHISLLKVIPSRVQKKTCKYCIKKNAKSRDSPVPNIDNLL